MTKPTKKPRLNPKQKLFADYLLSHPTATAVEAYRYAYPDAKSPKGQTVASSRALDRPSIQLYMESHVDKAKQRIVGLVASKNEKVALSASQDILDRTHGKATQQIEQRSTKLVIAIDLSGIQDTDSTD